MEEIKTKDKQNVRRRQAAGCASLESTTQLFFLGILSVGFVGHFAMRKIWPGFIFAHLAALGIMGFFGCLAGAIAKKKGYGYGMAFRFGFFVPLIFGVASAFLLAPAGDGRLPLTCGGWFSLISGIIVVLVYAVVRRRECQNE